MYLSKQMTDASLSEIGREFGKQQSTVMHSIARIHQLRAAGAGLNKAIETPLEMLTSWSGQD
jgi:chromosomal replication initiation ATPase DnaA